MTFSTFQTKPDAKRLTAKPRMVKCKVCKKPYLKERMSQVACGFPCAMVVAQQVAAKATRKLYAARIEAAKPRAKWLAEAQVAFNAYIRERDKNQPCICCNAAETKVNGHRAHGWDCGHYRSTGSAPHLRFDERNAHRQLVFCNRYGAGRAVDYRIGLIKRIGLEAVEALESDNEPRKFTVADLIAIKAHYRAKLKELKKAGE